MGIEERIETLGGDGGWVGRDEGLVQCSNDYSECFSQQYAYPMRCHCKCDLVGLI